MKLTANVAALKAATAAVAEVIQARVLIPVLSHIRLEADGGGLTLIGTDLDRRRAVTIDAEAEEDGAICVPGGLFKSFLNSLKDGELTIETDGHFALLSCGRRRAKLATLPVEDFPPVFPDMPQAARFTVDRLGDLLAPCLHAMSNEESRYYLCGVFLHLRDEGKTLGAEATDGYVFARVVTPAGDITGKFPDTKITHPGVIIPRNAVPVLIKMAAGGALDIRLDENRIEARLGRDVFTSKLVDGTFPDTDRIQPRDLINRGSFDRDALADALAALQAVRQEYQKKRITRVVFEKEAGAEQYELSAHDDTDNTITETLACEPAVDDAHTFLVKGDYLAAALGALPDKAETVNLLHADHGEGIVLQSDAAPNHFHLLMLMRM